MKKSEKFGLKVSSALFGIILIGATNLLADSASGQEENWGFTCSNEQVRNFMPENMVIGASGNTSVLVYDGKSLQVEKKNKMVKMWITYIAFPQGTENMVKQVGENYSEYGYAKHLKFYDIKNKRTKIISIANYTCSGNALDIINEDLGWVTTVPDSLDDVVMAKIKKEYKL